MGSSCKPGEREEEGEGEEKREEKDKEDHRELQCAARAHNRGGIPSPLCTLVCSHTSLVVAFSSGGDPVGGGGGTGFLEGLGEGRDAGRLDDRRRGSLSFSLSLSGFSRYLSRSL